MNLRPTYSEQLLTIPGGGSQHINRMGSVITILEATGGPFRLSIDEQTATDVRAGITFRMAPNERFRRFRIDNDGGSQGTIEIAIADGDIRDNRAAFVGELEVKNAAAPNNSVTVSLKADDPEINSLRASLLNGLRDHEDLRVRNVGYDETTVAVAASGGSQTLMTAANNSGGVIIHRLSVGGTASTVTDLHLDGEFFANIFCRGPCDLIGQYVPPNIEVKLVHEAGSTRNATMTFTRL